MTMISMKKTILVVSALALGGVAFGAMTARADEDMDARVAAAKKYEEIVPVEKMMQDVALEMEKNPQLNLPKGELGKIFSAMDMVGLREQIVQSMAKSFTVEEIEMLTEFYSKPEGKSVMQKMPEYMADVMPYIQQSVSQALMEVQKQNAEGAKDATESTDNVSEDAQ